MRKIILLALALYTATNIWAQSPEKMSYQAIVRDSDNTLITVAVVGTQISILQGSVDGVVVYEEAHNAMTNDNGLLSLEIGTGTVLSGDFTTIDWSNGPYFIKTETDPTGGNNYSIASTSQLLSVPYALYAATAGNNIPGPAGPQGIQGPPGNDGTDGQDGVGIASTVDNNDGTFTINYTDSSSFTTADLTGPQGAQGIQGEQGPIGPTGATGPQGVQGPPGNDGVDGLNGQDGTDGQDGVGISSTVDNNDGTFTINYTDGSSFTTADLTGPQGAQGIQGEQGPMGPTGFTGPQGIQGPPGNDGVDGLNGTDGADGQDGVGIASTVDNNDGTFTLNFTDGSSFTTADLTGPRGEQGIQGPPGSDGVDGLNGTDGVDGQDGVGISSTVDNNDGTFTINYTDGSSFTTADLTGPQGAQGIQGEQGPMGPTGLTGPQGIQGPPGNDGVDGLNGTDGADGQDGVGIASTVDNNDGTFTINYTDGSSFTTADLTGPQGEQGPVGPTGLSGPQGVQGQSGSDGVDGQSAYDVWLSLGNTGTEQDFIDSLTGPSGNGIESTTDNGDGTFTFDYTDGTSFTTSDLTGTAGNNGSLLYANSTGTSNNYIINVASDLTNYTEGLILAFKANFPNTGTSTLNVNSIGAVSIKKFGVSDLSPNDIVDTQLALVIYDGNNFQLINANSLSNTSGTSSNNVPVIYQSPIEFSNPGVYTWDAPPGVIDICIEIWGAGGPSGTSSGAGAGAFGYECFTVSPLETLTVIVGDGAEGGTSSVTGSNGNILIEALGGSSDGTGGISSAVVNYPGENGGVENGGAAKFGGAGGIYPATLSSPRGDGKSPGGGASKYRSFGIAGTFYYNGGNGKVMIYMQQ